MEEFGPHVRRGGGRGRGRSAYQVVVDRPLGADRTHASENAADESGAGEYPNKAAPTAAVGFDICLPRSATPVTLKPSLLAQNRERRNQTKRSLEEHPGRVLRPGMVLLKSHLSLDDQVKIVKTCRALGLGDGGFYQPGYRDGATLNLKMMCLGKNWDPQTRSYGDIRPVDCSEPPPIPGEFLRKVQKGIDDSIALIEKTNRNARAEAVLPRMSPDICIVNFYSASGRLGLHQDKDESPRSLANGLPVVSFSIGDSADFLYGDERDVDKAEKVKLESGDVLVFGGKSRAIFHGVDGIVPNTAPSLLAEQVHLRSGRLNLTFRQY